MRYLLFDADETLWDFKATEDIGLRRIFSLYDIEYTEEMFNAYMEGNLLCWREYECGALSLDDLEIKRWELFFKKIKRNLPAEETAKIFKDTLAHNGILLPGAGEFLDNIKDCPKSLVTNGISSIQRQRLKDTGIEPYFDNIFISSEIGYNKPQKELFEYIFRTIGKTNKECIMIGDSEHSDIQGAVNVGMESIYINFNGIKSETATYSASSYKELEALIRRI